MKPTHTIALLLAAMSAPAWSGSMDNWILRGDSPRSYEIGEDSQHGVSGKPARYIRYVDGDDQHFGTLMQQIAATNYAGKRVRFQAMVKTRDVSRWAGLWMSALRPGEMRAATFYNSQDKPITGSSDWQLRSVTLDIPDDAATLNFGVIDGGRGQVWIDKLSLEVVGPEVPVDVLPGRHAPALAPSL